LELATIIKKPLITEKTLTLAREGKYTFQVDKQASKKAVAGAIGKFFQVKVKKVWLLKVRGKKKRSLTARGKIIKKPDWKKAIVQLKKGEKIDFFEEA